MSVAAQVRMTGPLIRFREGFAAELTSRGYTDRSLANQLRLAADLSGWLAARCIAVADLDDIVVGRFLERRRRTRTQFVSRRALEPLLAFLVDSGVLTKSSSSSPPPRREELAAYEQYLVEERGVTPARQALCLKVAEEFLADRRVSTLTSADIVKFVKRATSDKLSALRSLLRFLFVSSRCKSNLVYAIPSSPGWRQQSLPQYLEPFEVRAVLATCDRRTLVGLRAYAALLLMVRMGLRAGEVAAINLDDIDWRTGEIAIFGKGRSLARLPLPVDVGHAIARYLESAKRDKSTRIVFVRCRAPYTAMSTAGIKAITQRAFRSAGILHGSAHRLRHTAATQMLRRGASLTEIAQVLRHQHVNTTAIYAKVDHDALRALARRWPSATPPSSRDLARPWPGGVS
jgi:integrase/recombinase XerD